MAGRLKGLGRLKLRKSTPDLSEWGKHDAKLIESLNKNDLNKLGSILTKKGISPTKLDPSGQTVFHRAAGDGKTGAVQVFINHKADVNARDSQDLTPLHYACKNGQTDTMKALLRGGASPLYEDKDRQTPLHKAAATGQLDAVKLMMRLQDAPININDVFGQTPLHLAAQNGHAACCEELINHGALPDYQDTVGRTPLMLGCEKGHSDVAEELITSGANIILKDKKGHNAMWYAVNFGRSDVESLLRGVPHDPKWEEGAGKASPRGSTAKPTLYRERSVDSGRGGTLNGHQGASSLNRSLDTSTAMSPMPEPNDEDDDDGYMVPIDEHPATSRTVLKPQLSQESKQTRAKPAKYDEQAYQALEEEYEELEASFHRCSRENKHLHTRVNSLQEQLPAAQPGDDAVGKNVSEVIDSYTDEILTLKQQLGKEKARTNDLSEKVKLLQFQLEKSDEPGRLALTTSEKDLRDLSAFGDFQEAHEKEVDDLHNTIKRLQKEVDDYCEENNDLKNHYQLEKASNIQIASELGSLQEHIDELRSTTTSAPIDEDMEDLVENRAQIDFELLQVQEILENLKNRPLGGPVDGSPFMEIERLRKENDELLDSNNDLQSTVSSVQQQLSSFQELANINDQLMTDNTNLRHDLEIVMKDMDVARNRKPRIIDGPDELVQYNAELSEENNRVKKDNDKLLSQLTEVQTDIEKTMSKLPSIEEFVATQQENERMRREVDKYRIINARQIDSLQEAAVQKEDMQQKLEDMRGMLANVTTGSWAEGSPEDQQKHIFVLREMVERLKEQNEILELEKQHAPIEVSSKSTLSKSSAHDPRDQSNLQTQNTALKEMIERLKEQIDILQSENPQKISDSSSKPIIDDLVARNRALEAMITKLTQEMSTGTPLAGQQSPRFEEAIHVAHVSSAIPVSATASNHQTENQALKHMVESLKEKVDILENEKQSTSTSSQLEGGKLKPDITRKEQIQRQGNLLLDVDNSDLLKENEALKEMVQRLREQNEYSTTDIYEQPKRATEIHRSISNASTVSVGNETEVVALREMVHRLKEQNELLESENQQKPITTESLRLSTTGSQIPMANIHTSSNQNDPENTALKEMVIRQKEYIEILELQHPEKPVSVDIHRSSSPPTLQSVSSQVDPNLNKEVVTLRAMVERLKEQIEILESENQKQIIEPQVSMSTSSLAASPMKEHSSLVTTSVSNDSEVIALKEMVIRLKEQNETQESVIQQMPKDSGMARSISNTSSVRSGPTGDDTFLQRENDALKEMIIRLKEQNEIQETQVPKDSGMARSISNTSSVRSGPTGDDTFLQRENDALKEMIIRLKEQIEIQETQVPKDSGMARSTSNTSSVRSDPTGDDTFLQRENDALKEMIIRLKEQIEIQETQVPKDSGMVRSISNTSSVRSGPTGDDTFLQRENDALKEMIIRLKEQNEIQETQVPKDSGMARSTSNTSSVRSGPTSDDTFLQRENDALKEMIIRLKEQNETPEPVDTKASDDIQVSMTTLTTAPVTKKRDGSDDSETIALKEMVQRLKEQNEILELENQSKPRSEIAERSVSIVSSNSSTNPQDKNFEKENYALKIMVERLKEQNEILEEENEQKRKDVNIHSASAPNVIKAQNSNNDSENIALKEMVIRLREQNEILETTSPTNVLNKTEVIQQSVQPTAHAVLGGSSDYQRENLALREMVVRLKEQKEWTPLDDPQHSDHGDNIQVSKVVSTSNARSIPNDSSDILKENQALKEMVIRLKEQSDISDADDRLSASRTIPPQHFDTSSLHGGQMSKENPFQRENVALKEMIQQQKEYIEDLEQEKRGSPDVAVMQHASTTSSAPPTSSAAHPTRSSDNETKKKLYALEQMVESLRERNEILESETDKRSVKVPTTNRDPNAVYQENIALKEMVQKLQDAPSRQRQPTTSRSQLPDVKELIALRAMVSCQKERIDILESDSSNRLYRQTSFGNNDDEKRRLRGEVERLENLLKQAADLNSVDNSDISELRSMLKMLNERNKLLEEQVLQVTNVNRQIGKQMAVNEELNAKNKGLETMIVHLTSELADEDNTEVHEVQSESIEPHQVEVVHAAPVMAGVVPKEETDILGLRREKDALKEMVKSLKERVYILENDLDKETEKTIKESMAASPLSSDLEDDNRRLRSEISILEGKISQSFLMSSDGDNHERRNDALIEMIESQKEKIDILELELSQKPKEVLVEMQDMQETDALKQMVNSQKERIEILQAQAEKEPKTQVVEVADTKRIDALSQMVDSQKERIDILEAQEEKEPKTQVVEVVDTKRIDALSQMVDSQKERIEILEAQEEKEPKTQVVEVVDTKRTDALSQMVESQKERIELLENENEQKPTEILVLGSDTKEKDAINAMLLSQKESMEQLEQELLQQPKEVSVEVKDTRESDALNQMVQSQKERIDLLESEVENKPKEVVVEVQDTKTNDALFQMVESQKEKIELLELELQQKPKEMIIEVKDKKETDVLNQMVHSQCERIELLELELEQHPKEIEVRVQDNSANDALKQMLESQTERIDVLEVQLEQSPSEVFVDVVDTKKNDALQQIVESQKETIEILERQREESPMIVKEKVDTSSYEKEIMALKTMVESLKERNLIIEGQHIKDENTAANIKQIGMIEELTAKNKGLESMIVHLTDEITENQVREEVLQPHEIELVQTIPTKSAASSSNLEHENLALKSLIESLQEKIQILETENSTFNDTYDDKIKPVENTGELLAMKEMINSQKERIEVLEHEQNHTGDAAQLTTQRSDPGLERENEALKQMVSSLKEQLDIIEVDSKIPSPVVANSSMENEGLRQMVESQRERINILENEKSQIGEIEIVSSKPLNSLPDDRDLEHAQAIVKLNEENTALKQIIESLQEKIELLETEKTEDYQPTGVLNVDIGTLEKENRALKEMVESLKESDGSSITASDHNMKDLMERNENLSTINVELQNQIEALEEVARLAEDFQTDRNKIAEENQVLNEEIFNLRQLTSFGDELKRERDNAIEDRVRIQDDLERLKLVLINSNDLEQEKYQWVDDKSNLESEVLGLKNTLDEQTKLLDGSEKHTESLQSENEQLALEIFKLKETLENKDSQIKEKESDIGSKLSTLNQLLATKDEELHEHENQMEGIHLALLNAKTELDKKDQEIASVKADPEKHQLLEENESLIEQNYTLMSEIEKLRVSAEERVVPIEISTAHMAAPTCAAPGVPERADTSVNDALEQMVESLKERNAILEAQIQKDDSISFAHEEMVAKNKGLEAMVTTLTDELTSLRSHTSSAPKDYDSENSALKQMVSSLRERIAILEVQGQDSNTGSIQNTLSVNSSVQTTDLINENNALKDMIVSLKERIEILENEQQSPNTIVQAPVNAQVNTTPKSEQSILKENTALKEMIISLQETIETLEKDKTQDEVSSVSSKKSELEKENAALQVMIKSLHDENETLQTAQAAADSVLPHSATLTEELQLRNEELQDDNDRLKDDINRLHKILNNVQADSDLGDENEALHEMVKQLKEEKEQLEQELEHKPSNIPVPAASNQQKQVDALEVMVQTLREEKQLLEKQLDNQSLHDSDAPPPIPTSPVPQIQESPILEIQSSHLASQPASSKENIALKEMVQSLKEENDALNKQLQVPTPVQQKTDSPQQQQQIDALKVMIESLKDDKNHLENQIEQMSNYPKPTSPLLQDESKLQKQTTALVAMVESLREKNELLENEELSRKTPALDKLTVENQILLADVSRLEGELKHTSRPTTSSEHTLKEIEALRAMVHGLKEENEILQAEKENESGSSMRPTKEQLERDLLGLQRERKNLLDNNEHLSGQISRLRKDFDRLQLEYDALRQQNDQLKAVVNGDVTREELLILKKEADNIQSKESQLVNLKDTVKDTQFEKIQLNGEVGQLKDKIENLQNDLDLKIEEAVYLKTENKDLRSFLHTMQETNRIPSDQLTRKMKEENYKLQNFIQMLESKVDRILSPDGSPRSVSETEKVTLENQLSSLQRQMEEERRKHKEIVNTYRTHLLAAVQGHIDPEVQKALQHIITLREPETSTSSSPRPSSGSRRAVTDDSSFA